MSLKERQYERKIFLKDLEVLLSSLNDKVIIVLFSVPWSGSGRLMEGVLESLQADNQSSVEFFVVNVEDDMDTFVQYGVGQIPSVSIFYQQELIGVYSQLVARKILQNKLDQYLN